MSNPKIVSELAHQILEGDLKTGEPWKLPKGTGFALPILKDRPFTERNYVLLQEVGDKVTFTDPGSLGKIHAANRSGSNVFIRKGTILKGVGTQPRSPVAGVVLEPNDKMIPISVNCIHASSPISRGAIFLAQSESVVPHSVHNYLGDQSEVWADIRDHGIRARASAESFGAPVLSAQLGAVRSDDLVRRMEVIENAKGTVEDVLSQIPGDHITQIGIAIFDLKGVVAVEVFDHPGSWRAFSKSIIRSYIDILAVESDLYEVKLDKAVEVLKSFLKKAADAVRNIITTNNVSTIWNLVGDKITGEIAEIGGKEIHTILTRDVGHSKNPRRRRGIPRDIRPRDIGSLFSSLGAAVDGVFGEPRHVPRRTQTSGVVALDPLEWYHRRGSPQLLELLGQRTQRFNELVDNMEASRGTVNIRLREAEALGLVEKIIREENGLPVWGLTTLGGVVKQKAQYPRQRTERGIIPT